MRCTKFAGLGILSALCVLNSSSSLHVLRSEGACCFNADVARLKWATEGGLKEESRMYSVFGCVLVGFTVRTTQNLAEEDVNKCSADSRSGSRALRDAMREAISAIMVVVYLVQAYKRNIKQAVMMHGPLRFMVLPRVSRDNKLQSVL